MRHPLDVLLFHQAAISTAPSPGAMQGLAVRRSCRTGGVGGRRQAAEGARGRFCPRRLPEGRHETRPAKIGTPGRTQKDNARPPSSKPKRVSRGLSCRGHYSRSRSPRRLASARSPGNHHAGRPHRTEAPGGCPGCSPLHRARAGDRGSPEGAVDIFAPDTGAASGRGGVVGLCATVQGSVLQRSLHHPLPASCIAHARHKRDWERRSRPIGLQVPPAASGCLPTGYGSYVAGARGQAGRRCHAGCPRGRDHGCRARQRC